MTIEPKNITEHKKRVQKQEAIMSCLDSMIWFNKYAAKTIGAPCSIKFDDLDSGDWFIKKEKDGFPITQNGDRFTITHSARKLVERIETIYSTVKPKFFIETTGNENIFKLKLIKQ